MGKDGRHPTAVVTGGTVTDGVDAPVDAVQASRANPPGHAALIYPRRKQLRNVYDSVLSPRDLSDLDVGRRVEFLSHSESKSTGGAALPGLALR
jgi:hypothetical protein